MKDYRKYYAQYYNIQWDSSLFDVHHIDRNRDNNDIRNLVLLPKKLHKELHQVYNEFDRMLAFEKDPFLDAAKEFLNPFGGYIVSSTISSYMHILNKCSEWGLRKSYNYGRPIGSDSKVIVELGSIFEL